MKNQDLIALLNRAAAALETPSDLTPEEKQHVIEDLVIAADSVVDSKVEPLTTQGSLATTYRQMGEKIKEMNDEQLDSNITVYVENEEEFYPADLRIVKEDDVLDENHPIIVISD